MKQGKFIQLKPLENMPAKIFIDAIYEDIEGFRIILSGEKMSEGTLRIKVDTPLVYRVTEESSIIELPIELVKDWWLFKVTDSDFIHWFSETSYHKQFATHLHHYFINSATKLIDIITDEEIKVDWLSDPV